MEKKQPANTQKGTPNSGRREENKKVQGKFLDCHPTQKMMMTYKHRCCRNTVRVNLGK